MEGKILTRTGMQATHLRPGQTDTERTSFRFHKSDLDEMIDILNRIEVQLERFEGILAEITMDNYEEQVFNRPVKILTEG